MLEDKITAIKREATQIRKKWNKITKQMEWYLDYQLEMLSIESSVFPCCTSYVRLQDQTPLQFQRGFKKLTKQERAQFYLMSVKNIDKNMKLHNNSHKHPENTHNRHHKIFKILIKDQGWFKNLTEASAELIKSHKKIRVQHLYQIQLFKYIIRRSSNKSLVDWIILQSIQPFSSSQTIRIFIKDNDIIDISKQISQCWLQAQEQRIYFMMMDSMQASKKVMHRSTLEKQQKILDQKMKKQQINIQQKNKHKNHQNVTIDQIKNFKNQIEKKDMSFNAQKNDFIENQKQLLFYSAQGSINTIDQKVDNEEEQNLQIQQIPNKIKIYEKKKELSSLFNDGQISFINDDYLQHCYQKGPYNKTNPILYKKPSGHIIFGKQWAIRSNGDLVFINYQKMKIHRAIFKKVIKKIGSNLLVGKGFNLTLPAVLFGTITYLQKIIQGYAYAPRFLERAAIQEDPVERMRNVICFMLGVAVNFVQSDKPLNPVLGETYQGLIDGCPVYAEQISHHPPISSVLFYGRGYKIYGNFEPEVEIGMNRLTGKNKGIHSIQFQDGTIIKCENALAVMNGLAFGQRKLQFIQKSEILDKSNRIICQIYWGKQNDINILSKSHNYVKAKIMKIKKRVNMQKIKNLKKNDFEEQYDDIYGQWTDHIYNNGQLIFDIKKDQPYQIEDYQPCLLSDSRFRQDLNHIKDNNFQQAQIYKDQIQQAQKYYRKLRRNNIC